VNAKEQVVYVMDGRKDITKKGNVGLPLEG
jgi:hypothetical protein